MRRPASGFTLIELVVVMAIIAILLAILAPGAGQVWQTLASTQCRQHLSVIFQAQAAWRVDSDGQNTWGKGWVGKLLPYMEHNESFFRCPSAAEAIMRVPEAAVRGRGGFAADSPAQPLGSERLESAFEFQVYRQAGSGAGGAKDGPDTGIRGELAYTIPVDSHPWVRRTQQGDAILYEMDDEGPGGGVDKPIACDDIRFLITYEGGRPRSLEILQQSCATSPYKKYVYDFMVNGEVLVSNWVTHVGESFDLTRSDVSGVTDSDPGMRAGAPRRASAAGPPVRYLAVPSDYGLSKGTYALPGTILGSMDPKLAMVLDYPKTLAEYTGEGGDEWKWDKYFIENPSRWGEDWGAAGEEWGEYQALRHFGRANVLFCDGHIESLGPEDLRPGRAIWSGQGR